MANRKRWKQLKLNLTEEEYKYFNKKYLLSKKNSYSDFVLSVLDNTVIKSASINIRPFTQLSTEINKIGVNINQIAKIANTSGHVSKKEFIELKEYLNVINKNQQELLKIIYDLINLKIEA